MMQTFVKTKVLGMLVLMAAIMLAGCSTRGMTAAEVNQRHYRTIQNDWWQIQDDIDSIFMLERPSRLSRQMVR